MTKQSILLVDDEDVLRLSLQTNLKREGFEINTADEIVRLGADAFFCKPIGFDNLVELITQTLAS
jgi:DNA-binding response OmpR family regulator